MFQLINYMPSFAFTSGFKALTGKTIVIVLMPKYVSDTLINPLKGPTSPHEFLT